MKIIEQFSASELLREVYGFGLDDDFFENEEISDDLFHEGLELDQELEYSSTNQDTGSPVLSPRGYFSLHEIMEPILNTLLENTYTNHCNILETRDALRRSRNNIEDEIGLKNTITQLQVEGKRENDRTCSICMDDIEEEDLATVKGCEHKFCRSCLAGYCTFKTMDAASIYHQVTWLTPLEQKFAFQLDVFETYGIPCPSHKCKHVIAEKELKVYTTEDAIERFLRFCNLHNENTKRIAELHNNPNPEEKELICPKCRSVSIKKTRRGRARCNKCMCPFCISCGLKHSPSMTCEEFQADHIKRQVLPPLDDNKLNKELGLVRCPKCQVLTTKISGCNFMTCRCGKAFCNICGCSLDETKHFSHFSGAPFGDKCLGYSDASPM